MNKFDLETLSTEELIHGEQWLEDLENKNMTHEELLQALLPAMECPQEFLTLFEELSILTEERLQNLYKKKNIRVRIFGSILIGLGFKNSDLDINIDFDKTVDPRKTLMEIRKFFNTDFRDVFVKTLYINAKIPILRCTHEVGFQCDISTGNVMAVYNSMLIRYYLSLNKSFYLFFMCVKLWMKRQDSVSVQQRMKNYATALLCIFFLQQKSYVPSVHYLQTNKGSPEPFILDGWNVAFLFDESYLEEELSVLDLLTGFFKFYSQFEFGFYIISPFLGRSILKPLLKTYSEFTLYNEQSQKLECRSHICLQDPFIHNFNPCRNVTRQFSVDFQTWCNNAKTICEEASSSPKSKLFLTQLFSTNSTKRKKKKKKATYDNKLTFFVGKALLTGSDEDELRSNWVEHILKALEMVITRILKGTVTRKKEQLICEICHITLVKKLRSEIAASKGIDDKLPNLQRQEMISNEIMKLPSFKRDLFEPMQLIVSYETTKEPTSIIFKFSAEKSPNYFSLIMAAFCKHLDPWIEEYMVTIGECS